MYKIIKNVIETGSYDLTTLLKKIDTFWIEGKLTDKEYEELNAIARGGASPEYSIDVYAKLEELDRRMSAVESGFKTEDKTEEEYPEYVAGKWYYKGDKVSFEGTNYICIAPEGTVCVWSPKDYPTYWEAE